MIRSNMPSRNGSRTASPFTTPGNVPWRRLAGVEHGEKRPRRVLQVAGRQVERHHAGTAAGGFERVATAASAHVEEEITGLDAQAAVVNREQVAARVPAAPA